VQRAFGGSTARNVAAGTQRLSSVVLIASNVENAGIRDAATVAKRLINIPMEFAPGVEPEAWTAMDKLLARQDSNCLPVLLGIANRAPVFQVRPVAATSSTAVAPNL
jgi:hypothetical protein